MHIVMLPLCSLSLSLRVRPYLKSNRTAKFTSTLIFAHVCTCERDDVTCPGVSRGTHMPSEHTCEIGARESVASDPFVPCSVIPLDSRRRSIRNHQLVIRIS